MHKKLITIFFLLISTLAFSQDNLVHSSTSYVDDYANILSAPTKQKLDNEIRSFKESSKIEFSIVTVPTLNDRDIESFTLDLARRWGVGTKANQGVMILIAPKEHLIRTEVGYGLEGDLPDIYVTEQQDKITHYFKENNYDAGITELLETYIAYLNPTAKEQRAVAAAKQKELNAKQWQKTKNIASNILIWLLILGGLTFLVIKMVNAKIKRKEAALQAEQQRQYLLQQEQDRKERELRTASSNLTNVSKTYQQLKDNLISAFHYDLITKDELPTFDYVKLSSALPIPLSVNELNKNSDLIEKEIKITNEKFKSQLNWLTIIKHAEDFNLILNHSKENLLNSVENITLRNEKIKTIVNVNPITFDSEALITKINSITEMIIDKTKFSDDYFKNFIASHSLKEALLENITNELSKDNKELQEREDFISMVKSNPRNLISLRDKIKEDYDKDYIPDFAVKYLLIVAIIDAFLNAEKNENDFVKKNLLAEKARTDIYKITKGFDVEQNNHDEIEKEKQRKIAAERQRKQDEEDEEDEEERRRNNAIAAAALTASSYDSSSSSSSYDSGSSFGGGSFGGGGGTSGW